MGYKHPNTTTNTDLEQSPASLQQHFTWWGRFKAEFRRITLFDVEEVDGRSMDVKRTFTPHPRILVSIVKVLLCVWLIEVLTRDLLKHPNDEYYFMYLTSWALVLSILYLLVSAINSVFDTAQQQNNKTSFLIRTQWALFSMMSTGNLIVVLLYWALDYPGSNDSVDYFNIMQHGGSCLVVLFEGLVICRTPVRIWQFVFVLLFSLSYLIWTIIHAYTNIGNPNRVDNDPETDDDAIYENLSWKHNTTEAVIIAVVCILVICPVFFLLVWSLSLYSCCWGFDGSSRRYVEDSRRSSPRRVRGEARGDVEEGEDDDTKSKGVLTMVGIDL